MIRLSVSGQLMTRERTMVGVSFNCWDFLPSSISGPVLHSTRASQLSSPKAKKGLASSSVFCRWCPTAL